MTPAVTVSVVKKQPGIFTIEGTGSGQAIVQNADGTLNSSSNLAAKGSTISILATGAGQNTPDSAGRSLCHATIPSGRAYGSP